MMSFDEYLKDKGESLEEAKKWLQKAIHKSAEGACHNLNAPTCTPRRKALAKRLKPGGDLYKGKKKKK